MFLKEVKNKYCIISNTTKILMIDDDPNICNMMKDYLAVEHIKLDCCQHFACAKIRMQNNDYKYVIIDGFVGRENGVAIAKKIKEAFPKTKLIFNSGSTLPESSHHLFDAVFTKIDFEKLISYITK